MRSKHRAGKMCRSEPWEWSGGNEVAEATDLGERKTKPATAPAAYTVLICEVFLPFYNFFVYLRDIIQWLIYNKYIMEEF